MSAFSAAVSIFSSGGGLGGRSPIPVEICSVEALDLVLDDSVYLLTEASGHRCNNYRSNLSQDGLICAGKLMHHQK